MKNHGLGVAWKESEYELVNSKVVDYAAALKRQFKKTQDTHGR
jgi:hypothetical protein